MNIYPYWFELQKKLLIIYAENILIADNVIKIQFKLNPIHSVLKTLQLTFSDLTNNQAVVVRGLDKNGEVIKSNYPSQDNFELTSRGAIHNKINLLTTEDFELYMKTKPKANYTKVSLSAGNIPITWGFTLDELNKKISDTYS